MALNLTQGISLASDGTLQARVALACYFQARQVLQEDVNTENHTLRVTFARAIMQQNFDQFVRYTSMVVTDPDIVAATPALQTNISDGQIINAISRMWNALAGV